MCDKVVKDDPSSLQDVPYHFKCKRWVIRQCTWAHTAWGMFLLTSKRKRFVTMQCATTHTI